jgi:hypothetical protein
MPYGGSIAKMTPKRWLFEHIEEEMRRLGLQMNDDKLAINVDAEQHTVTELGCYRAMD